MAPTQSRGPAQGVSGHALQAMAYGELRVEDALDVGDHRVSPETPLAEVVDLMVREHLRAVPVVGTSFEVLGILTSGDALGHLLKSRDPDAAPDEAAHAALARDFMTRSVLCVSEDQPLSEAANSLVNRGVQQLPVVRAGRFIGFVTRDSVLAALSRSHDPTPTEPEGDTP